MQVRKPRPLPWTPCGTLFVAECASGCGRSCSQRRGRSTSRSGFIAGPDHRSSPWSQRWTSSVSGCPSRGDDPAHVVRPRGGTVPHVVSTVAGKGERVAETPEIFHWVVVGRERGSCPVLPRCRAESGIGQEEGSTAQRLQVELEIGVPQESPGRTPRLKRQARRGSQTTSDDPGGIVLVQARTGRRDDGCDRLVPLASEVAGGTAGVRLPQGDHRPRSSGLQPPPGSRPPLRRSRACGLPAPPCRSVDPRWGKP